MAEGRFYSQLNFRRSVAGFQINKFLLWHQIKNFREIFGIVIAYKHFKGRVAGNIGSRPKFL